MLIHSVKMQMAVLLKRKSAVIMYLLMLSLVLINYFTNIFKHNGKDAIIQMYHPMKLILLSDFSGLGFIFMQYFPLLVVVPAAFSFILERNANSYIFIQSRVGEKNYYFGKLIAVFLTTFIVFTLPLLIEIGLSCIAFPLSATGDPSNLTVYDPSYIEGVRRYLFSSLYLFNPYLYAVFYAIILGLVSGVLATFALAISTFRFVKFKIMIFLPVYILLYLLSTIGSLFDNLSVSTNYFFYLRMYSPVNKSGFGYFTLIMIILCISVLIINFKCRKDTLE